MFEGFKYLRPGRKEGSLTPAAVLQLICWLGGIFFVFVHSFPPFLFHSLLDYCCVNLFLEKVLRTNQLTFHFELRTT